MRGTSCALQCRPDSCNIYADHFFAHQLTNTIDRLTTSHHASVTLLLSSVPQLQYVGHRHLRASPHLMGLSFTRGRVAHVYCDATTRARLVGTFPRLLAIIILAMSGSVHSLHGQECTDMWISRPTPTPRDAREKVPTSFLRRKVA